MNKKGWLIYNSGLISNKFSEIHQWYIKTAKKHAIDLVGIPNQALIPSVLNNRLTIQHNGLTPDFVLYLDKDISLANQLESIGIPLFNSAQTIELCDNKISMHQQLAMSKLPQPDTIFAPMLFQDMKNPSEHFLTEVEQQLDYPLVIKEAFGSFGQQVYLIKNRDELEQMAKKLIRIPHLFQRYLPSSHGKDVRIHVVGDQVVAAMQRQSSTDFRANITSGGQMFHFKPDESFCQVAINASKAVGADFSGVDLLFGENGEPIICEVNSNAHIKNIHDCTGIDVTETIFTYILNQLAEK
ncbi:gamma-F420-2:alpha-L-glutamate ligase [Amphibacillus marinus]|uniref:Gamma-F420-2:alpha-L-glutamate ligase n=1 Tax=Amphibacillus marinus TaxID=872970 RepID=A0A1H8QUT3_9BACI|nr:RimK family alpha-L-glutamate ligase [Amphibacillus marinus]SEO57807.1 gamma-F420-2:alpha-L-glutamate ligase [Amphibacillus marinus]